VNGPCRVYGVMCTNSESSTNNFSLYDATGCPSTSQVTHRPPFPKVHLVVPAGTSNNAVLGSDYVLFSNGLAVKGNKYHISTVTIKRPLSQTPLSEP
jgi:hypothetical protein